MYRDDCLRLNTIIDDLSCRPFSDPSETIHKLMLRTTDLEKQLTLLSAALETEQHHVQQYKHAQIGLRKQIDHTNNCLKASIQEEECLRLKCIDLEAELEAVQFKYKMIQNPTDEILTETLALVTKSHVQPTKVSFLEKISELDRLGNKNKYIAILSFFSVSLQEKLNLVMDASAQTFAEVAKFEEIAGIYQGLNSDLEAEIKRLNEQRISEVNFLKEQLAKANDAKDACQLQLARILAKNKTHPINSSRKDFDDGKGRQLTYCHV
jgi:hypothetical protein